jgi:hypothetical protein
MVIIPATNSDPQTAPRLDTKRIASEWLVIQSESAGRTNEVSNFPEPDFWPAITSG